ncbi:head-tail joining protein [Vibrio phage 3.058.O._10N.286.46.B8]|uniref:head closure Hc1 n=1 Tax=Vibrio phage henriette 12B8 TaxID=573174 RepID=UPI0002C0CCD6|nr:head closure Hc1 [Vibrio phage henriette 12B8]AGG58294.1 head-tail adaptor [Vibrio phage henriette 12B8]AUS01927.1 head-tail joining protein [Vibrio phage 2.058.O._10N.286.46.B8]AUS03079.1 head-tail joining protein [Vibrio phage 3.058.O._10N.286.46.B8]
MAVRAGRYRERLSIMSDSGKRNDFGGSTNERTLVQSPWCKVRVVSDNENDGERTTSQTILEFEIRYSKSLENPSGDMFVTYRGLEYDIISVINQHMLNEKLLIMAKKRR